MSEKLKPDFETLSLFVILGVLTLILVLGLRWVLFDPSPSPHQHFPESSKAEIGSILGKNFKLGCGHQETQLAMNGGAESCESATAPGRTGAYPSRGQARRRSQLPEESRLRPQGSLSP